MATSDRGTWGSRTGFILAAAGSAVGLGNIWGFPTQVGQGGGAVFVLVYLFCVFFVCAPIFISELLLGRGSEKGPVGAFRSFAPGTKWWLVGALGVMTGVGILSFYSVIAGWTVAYIGFMGFGNVGSTAEEIGSFFGSFTANGAANVGLTFFFLVLTAACILGGVREGIERVTKALMPLLIILLLVLAVRALTLPGAAEGLAYYLKPDFSKLWNFRVVTGALGQAFFSLSLGMGALITYGSYMNRRDNLGVSALWVVGLDTMIALLAGFIIFPTGFSIAGFDPSTSGPGLIFQVLPQLFATLPGGRLFGMAFFILLATAALTSTISLLEVPVSHFIDEYRWRRKKAVIVLTLFTFVLSIPSALGNGAVAFLTNLPLGGFLGLMATLWNNYSLPIGGFLVSIFVAYFLGLDKALRELTAENAWFPSTALWSFLIRFVCPVAIAIIILSPFLSQLFS
ncbi:MAG TPA: sodium-dependent transporter [Vicinamibacteria bacterium]|nr:sodium-dependent transporter [Vicinamibacteria bacterium]